MATGDIAVLRPADFSDTPLLPRWVREEWLFWIVFASWAVLPTSRTPIWSLDGLLVRSTDIALIPLCLLLLLPRIISPTPHLRRGWHLGIPLALLGMCGFGYVSTAWSGDSPAEAFAMRYTTAVAAASGLFAYLVISSLTDVRAFLQRLAAALSGVCLVYTAQSLLGLGLRSAEAIGLNDFGIDRVRGPLFESSTGYFLLIPAFAFLLQETLQRRIRPLYGFVCCVVLAMTVVGLGSRAGYALFGAFAVSCLLVVKGRQRTVAIALMSVAGLAAAGAVFSRANTNRLTTKTKDGRTLMHEAVLRKMERRSWSELALGSGLGSVWPWYLTEVEGGDLYLSGRYMRHTPDGILLYHPHSTVLLMGVELGLAGLAFLLALGSGVLRAVLRAMRAHMEMMFAWGVMVSVLSIEFDLFFVRRPTRDAVWWLFFFGLLALLGQRRISQPVQEMAQ